MYKRGVPNVGEGVGYFTATFEDFVSPSMIQGINRNGIHLGSFQECTISGSTPGPRICISNKIP